MAEAEGLTISVSLPADPVWFDADPDRLAQVFSNLLNNASKYTEAGGRIVLSAEREDGEAVVRVTDTGIGIDPELLPHVFDLFAQSDRTIDRSQGGLGIGLTGRCRSPPAENPSYSGRGRQRPGGEAAGAAALEAWQSRGPYGP